MKRIYLVLAMLIGLVGTMWADTTLTTTDNNQGSGYYGFTTKLTDTFYTLTGDAMNDKVWLKTLDIYGRQSGGSGSDFKIAIYKYSSDGTTGEFVALSDNSNSYVDCGTNVSVSMTFKFRNVKLSKTQQYQFLFVNSSATESSVSSFDGYKEAAVSESLRVFSNSGLPGGDGTYRAKTLNSWEGLYMPKVKFVVNNEPFENTKVYTIKGYSNSSLNAYYDGTNNYVRISTTAGTNDNYKWAIYTVDGKKYLYNVGAGKLVYQTPGTGGHYNWPLSDNIAYAINFTNNGDYYTLRSEYCTGGQDYLHYNGDYTYGSTNWGPNADNSKWTIEEEAGDLTESQQNAIEAMINASKFNLPETDKLYKITGIIGEVKEYISYDGSARVASKTENSPITSKDLWYLTQGSASDKYYIRNAYDENQYFGFDGVSTTAYDWKLEVGTDATQKNVYSLYGVAKSRYLGVGTNDMVGNDLYAQSKQSNTAWSGHYYSTNFQIEEIETNTLTINTTPAVTGVFTWNGETKRGTSVTFTKIAGMAVEDNAITAIDNGYIASLSASEWDGERDLTVTATMTPNFFSSDIENAKWVSINNVHYSEYTLYANSASELHSHQITGDENELFALVGNANSFRLYSKTKQAYFGAANDSQNTPVVADGTNNTYKLVAKTGEYAGYAIVPTGNEGQSFNMYKGAGNDIKYYSAGDDGATWNVSEVVRHNITIALDSENPHANNYQIAKLSVSYDGKTSTSYITKEDVGTKSIYLPTGMEPTLSVDYQYHGYTNTIDGTTVTFAYDGTNYQYLWYEHPDYQFYRIPAIVTNRNGEMIALSDYRYCHNDIGFGRVDQYMRRSADNGKTWTEPELVVAGTDDTPEDAFYKGFGDPALCADRESDRVILMTVAGNNFYGNANTNYWNGKPNYFARLYSYDGGHTWSEPENITEQIYKLFAQESSDANAVAAAFVGSGKIFQSRVTKVGEYYRLYAALCARPNGNRVIYSDDFGQTWNVLGGADARPAPNGDEPKCEELPDGSVILSSRKYYGRFFNIYNYTDVATGAGSWNGAIASDNATNGISVGNNATNGEIMIVRAKKANDDKIYTVALQSLPFGNNRSQVGLWWKDITETSSYQSNGVNTSSVFASNWTRGLQVEDVKTNGYSAYSTFTLQADGKIGFFYEESPGTYAMVYIPLTIGEITKGAYSEIIANVGELAHADNSTKQNPVLEGEVPSPEAVVSTIDETATSIDLTNTTVNSTTTVDDVVEAVVAKTGNANTVVYAPSGSETTKNNVVVDGTCASLVLTDKMPFSAPNKFTASNAVYTRTMANKWGTICLPYAVTSNENEAYYTIDRIEDGKLIINQVESLEAGKPGLVQKFAGDGIAPAATSVEVVGSSKDDQTLVDGTVTMIGSFANDTKVTDENAFYIKDNKFWQRAEASEQIADPCFYIDAFRAYFTVEPAANQSRIMSIVVNGDEATGIDALEIAEALSGKEGKFLQNGRVVIVKDNRQYTTAGQRLK